MPLHHALGAIPDAYDPRDFIFESLPHRFAIGAIPPSVDLRKWCSPVRDQGQQGSCTGFALTALREFMEIKSGNPVPEAQLSPAFIYYEERQQEGTTGNCNAGAMIRDGFRVLNKTGACPETDDPYSDATCKGPSRRAMTDARKFTISAYHRITTVGGLKQALAAGDGCVLGIAVYSSFESLDAGGHVPMPTAADSLEGGHAIFCCGYSDDAAAPGGGYLLLKNSWGSGYGLAGYIYLPYAYVTPKLVSDMWTATA